MDGLEWHRYVCMYNCACDSHVISSQSHCFLSQSISNFAVIEVVKPKVGERKPARVRADVTLQLNLQKAVKEEWESQCTSPLFSVKCYLPPFCATGLKKHDVCFLITCQPETSVDVTLDYTSQFVPQVCYHGSQCCLIICVTMAASVAS